MQKIDPTSSHPCEKWHSLFRNEQRGALLHKVVFFFFWKKQISFEEVWRKNTVLRVEVFYMLDSNQSNNIHGETLALSHDSGAYPFQSIEIRHLKNGRDSNTHVLALFMF
jgi:hypothetical protein